MSKKIISKSFNIKKGLDDDYTLYEDGTVEHYYDKSIYPGGYSLTKNYTVEELSQEIKQRLLDAASNKNKEKVAKVLKLGEI